MATYCISDIHGCLDEFNALVEKINFNPEYDTLYILGDVIDRGDYPIGCLQYIMKNKSMQFILGNHERMMLDYFDEANNEVGKDMWLHNGSDSTEIQLLALPKEERAALLEYLKTCPLYKTIDVNGRAFFLSHAGLDVRKPIPKQTVHNLTWSRESFLQKRALKTHICIHGHTPTHYLNVGENDCSVWVDMRHKDKICIDCGCVYGGAMAALRLDDFAVFYAKSAQEALHPMSYKEGAIPSAFYGKAR